MKKYILSYLFYTIAAFGVSISIVANVGVSSYNAMNLSVASVMDIKIGTMTIFFNMLFLLAFMILTNFKKKLMYLIQTISVLMFGSLINFYVYFVFKEQTVHFYPLGILLIILGTIIGGTSIGIIVHLNKITFPVESLCLKLSEITPLSFVKLRYGVDILAIAIALVLFLTGGSDLYIREGTVISMLLLSPVMNFSKSRLDKKMQKK